MDYLFEQLGDDRFQLLCASLLNKEFPNVQTLPINQSDGGRDSIMYLMKKPEKEFIVFQVKFVNNPLKIVDPHKWFIKIISKELPKIKKLIPKGATEYYLITNVKGTAHLDNGSIDILNKILEKEIPIPSMCWWRDDINSKVNNNVSLKWSFPEIMKGTDVLGALLFNSMNENKEMRESVIEQYLVDQYELDNKVKFKQIDLQNNLLDLFTDVPIGVKKIKETNKVLNSSLKLIKNDFDESLDHFHPYYRETEDLDNIGAANFLLNHTFENDLNRILLEGGPGQGKSTISQFICQIHRIRLLGKDSEFKDQHQKYLQNHIRLPFKIDLRHLASWIEKKNPYKETVSEEFFKECWGLSLKEFLIFHIYYHSKNKDFKMNDLFAVFKISNVLLVLDGFDEVANIEVRNQVVKLIMAGSKQLEHVCKSLQIIITSRPAAFSDSLEFPVEDFPHLQLRDINSKIINEYTDKWITACKLKDREGKELKKLVNEKVNLPHLKELAKSPMQLAIFINLLRTKGESLPNKRTALYDSYINLFFDREAEKNELIRDNRDLIIDIHQYFAWVLHSEAEWDKTNGIITIEDLREKLSKYLDSQGHNTDITRIFQVVEERVCALVSRVQGTFEFEVQPLREYFCAKFLFKTSPYCPPGQIEPGTKPERFDAISVNSYWQNVLRFFAGCIDVGELPMLNQKLEEMVEDDSIKFSNYPYVLISQLLSDYVFFQSPINQKKIIQLLLDGLISKNLSFRPDKYDYGDTFNIPQECGGNEIVEECFKILKTFPKQDYADEICEILKEHPYNLLKYWKDYLNETSGNNRDFWIRIGYQINVLKELERKEAIEILKAGEGNFVYLVHYFIGNNLDILESDLELKKQVLKLILDGNITFNQLRRNEYSNSLSSLCSILDYYLISKISKENPTISYIEYCSDRNLYSLDDANFKDTLFGFKVSDEVDELISTFLLKIKENIESSFSSSDNQIKLWDGIILSGREVFGNKNCFNIMASIVSGIAVEKRYKNVNINNENISLYNRSRFGRLKSGNVNYWRKKLVKGKISFLEMLLFFSWATPRTIYNLRIEIEDLIKKTKPEILDLLFRNLQYSSYNSKFSLEDSCKWFNDLEDFQYSFKFLALISQRMNSDVSEEFSIRCLRERDNLPASLSSEIMVGLILKLNNNKNTNALLEDISKFYKINNKGLYINKYRIMSRVNNTKISIETAKNILSFPDRYPRILFNAAQKIYKAHLSNSVIPVGITAKKENWLSYY